MSELTGYAPPAAAQESEDSYSYINSVAAAENGDLLVSETVSMTVFELPEGFSGTEEEKYEYADYVSTDYLRLLDSTGAEKSIVDLTAAAEAWRRSSRARRICTARRTTSATCAPGLTEAPC